MSFPPTAADQSLAGRDDPEAVGGSAIAGTLPTADDVAGPPPSTSLPIDAVDVARTAAVEEAGNAGLVGDYLGAIREDDVAVTASFAAADRGYRGWYWSVTLAMVEPGQETISEVVLLPGEQALLAPSWVPWEKRIRSGDVGPGDLLPTAPDDQRLVPGYVDSDDAGVKEVEYEFGFGRVRVLSREGRDDAAQRWHDGPFGPFDAVAQQAQANCVTCGFYIPLRGLMGMAMGACANEFSPADGRVVDAEYGCGAHSQTVIDAPLISASTATVVDELTLEVHHRRRAARSEQEQGPGDADLVDVEGEPVGPDVVDVAGEPVGPDVVDVEDAAVGQDVVEVEGERTPMDLVDILGAPVGQDAVAVAGEPTPVDLVEVEVAAVEVDLVGVEDEPVELDAVDTAEPIVDQPESNR